MVFGNFWNKIGLNMKKSILSLATALVALASNNASAFELLSYGNFDHWITRQITESHILGGNTKTVYEIGPTQTIVGNKPYVNLGGSPWGTSNVYAKVHGIVKASNAVYPDTHNGGQCAKLTTKLEHVKALGIINMDVLVGGTIFTGQMIEPVKSTSNPYANMNMGIRFTKRPKYLQFDYKLYAPSGSRIYSSGFGKKKTLPGKDHAEVFLLLQYRWEDAKGNIHAKRVGTARQRFSTSTSGWVNAHRIPVLYGDIRNHSGYQSYMALIPKAKSYYARNSKGKMVPVVEEGWASADQTPTHAIVMCSSACGTAYEGTVGMTLWVDNIGFVY